MIREHHRQSKVASNKFGIFSTHASSIPGDKYINEGIHPSQEPPHSPLLLHPCDVPQLGQSVHETEVYIGMIALQTAHPFVLLGVLGLVVGVDAHCPA